METKEIKALEYYDNYCQGDFNAAALPLMIYMAKEHHPHTSAIIQSDRAELLEALKCYVNDKFIVD